jgi:hypothetical protein
VIQLSPGRAARQLIVWLLLGAGTTTVHAQARLAKGVLDGAVTDTSLVPIAGATAWIVGSRVEATTDSSGRFRIVDLPPNQYVVLIRQIGYAPLSSTLRIAEGDTVRAAFALHRALPVLDTVVATANRAPSRLQEFEDRRRLGQGKYLTQAEIERMNLVGTVDLLRTFSAYNRGTNPRGAGLESCPYQYFLDGVPLQIRSLQADLPPPGQLAGIELYVNSATVPL